MRNKPKDIPYCGVDTKKIQNFNVESIDQNNLDLFLYYIGERYRIHIRKDLKHLPQPWTDDKILRKYRFTNVRREQDYTTRWLIDNICKADIRYLQKLANIVLFRIFNKVSTAELLGIPISSFKNLDPIQVAEDVESMLTDTPFTGAYLCSGLKTYMRKYAGSDSDIESALILVRDLTENRFWRRISHSSSPQEVIDLLQECPGISEFMSYQMFIDFTYVDEFPFSENEYTVAGIGATLGLKILFGGTKRKHGLTPEEFIFWMRDNWEELNQYNTQHGGKHTLNPQILFQDLPEEDRVMNVMSIENCLCEFSKYYKSMTGTGRPRQSYAMGGSK